MKHLPASFMNCRNGFFADTDGMALGDQKAKTSEQSENVIFRLILTTVYE